MFHSAKTSAPMGSDPSFFALAAYSFKTAVTDQKDAYMILNLSDEPLTSHSTDIVAGKTKRPRDSTADQSNGKEYILWELSCG